ncbi:hypothetical protein tpqmel_0573 [Candidatus Gastranaerophilus sp. (ex Termes propinquus)]|nr:hypothetical protein tpqmel_0573 [Candidatus Gastranaerophilus sp. (ex Termes propinquus)]
MYKKLFGGILLIMLASNLAAQASDKKSSAPKFGSRDMPILSDIDYSCPDKWLRFGGDKRKEVDVFIIYPTVIESYEEADSPYVRIDSQLMYDMTTELSHSEGTVSEWANVYVPLYRQLNGALLSDLTSYKLAKYVNATPREDIFAAFDYFLKNINKGERPFVLFGFSQGAELTIELATTFLGSEKYYKYNRLLVAAYAIGMSVTKEQIVKNPNLRFSNNKYDTGVILSWNTTAPSEIASGAYTSFITWKKGALVTNPISWETDEMLMHASKNKASCLMGSDGTFKTVENYANAVADKEHCVLVTTTVDEANYEQMVPTVSKFHGGDIAFYYESIKQNVKDRIGAFYK